MSRQAKKQLKSTRKHLKWKMGANGNGEIIYWNKSKTTNTALKRNKSKGMANIDQNLHTLYIDIFMGIVTRALKQFSFNLWCAYLLSTNHTILYLTIKSPRPDASSRAICFTFDCHWSTISNLFINSRRLFPWQFHIYFFYLINFHIQSHPSPFLFFVII